MRKISCWAKTHKGLARTGIVVSFILLNILGIATGSILPLKLPAAFLVFFISLFLLGVAAYPTKGSKPRGKNARNFYRRQKIQDFLLAGSTFCMTVFFANRPERFLASDTFIGASNLVTILLPKDSSKTYLPIGKFAASMKDANGKTIRWKERKKLLKEQIRDIKKSNDLSSGTKTLLVILSVIVAIGLLALIAGLACNISCSGSDGAALLVGIGGLALIIFLLVITIHAIYGRKKHHKKPPTSDGNSG